MNYYPQTIAGFIAVRRIRANKIEREGGRTPNRLQRELIAVLRDEADQLEAAWKRELSKNMSKNGVDFGQTSARCVTK